jgi:hypothetical protein
MQTQTGRCEPSPRAPWAAVKLDALAARVAEATVEARGDALRTNPLRGHVSEYTPVVQAVQLVVRRQIRVVLSVPPQASRSPSGLKASDVMRSTITAASATPRPVAPGRARARATAGRSGLPARTGSRSVRHPAAARPAARPPGPARPGRAVRPARRGRPGRPPHRRAVGAWHLPVLLDRGVAEIVLFLLAGVALSVILTWLYGGSGGSLIPALLFYAAQNSAATIESHSPRTRRHRVGAGLVGGAACRCDRVRADVLVAEIVVINS